KILAGVGIRRNQTGAEEVVASAISSILIDRWGAEWHIDDAALFVHGEEAPHVHSGPVFPAVSGPGVAVLFPCLGNRVERPGELPRAHIPGPDIPSRSM